MHQWRRPISLMAGLDCSLESDWAVARVQTHSYLRTTCLGTHLRQRTGWKAEPGRGGGGWLRRDWGLADGSGTRVSVRSPVYVGLTAFVSKAAKGGENRWCPRGSAGKKDIKKGLRPWASAGFECTNAVRTQWPARTQFNPPRQEGSTAKRGQQGWLLGSICRSNQKLQWQ